MGLTPTPAAGSHEDPLTQSTRVAPIMTGRRAHEVTRARGIVERHELACSLSGAGKRCTCSPGYRARVRLRRRTVTKTFASLASALQWADAARDAVRDGRPVEERTARTAPLLGPAAHDFIDAALAGSFLKRNGHPLSEARVKAYRSSLRLHVLEHVHEPTGLVLGDLPADQLTTRSIDRMVRAVTVSRSAETARGAHAALAALLRYLYESEQIEELPQSPRLPSPAPPRTVTISFEEADRLCAAARADDAAHKVSLMAPLVAVLSGAGTRIGEALSLRWGTEGVDLERGVITVSRESTKSDAGARSIPVQDHVVRALREHRLAMGRPEDGAWVFPSPRGGHRRRDGAVRTSWDRVVRAAGLGPSVTCHVLRHSHATWLDERGYPLTALALRMGHSDPAFTARRYIHRRDMMGQQAISLLDSPVSRPATGPTTDVLNG
jgi:integrase/recombinase XerD